MMIDTNKNGRDVTKGAAATQEEQSQYSTKIQTAKHIWDPF